MWQAIVISSMVVFSVKYKQALSSTTDNKHVHRLLSYVQ